MKNPIETEDISLIMKYLNDNTVWFDVKAVPLVISAFAKEINGDKVFLNWNEEKLKNIFIKYVELAEDNGISKSHIKYEIQKKITKIPSYIKKILKTPLGKQNKIK